MSQELAISVVTGTVASRDAISNVCRQQVEAMDASLRERRIHSRIRIYTQGAQIADSRLAFAETARAVAIDPHFRQSRLVLAHFGIGYPLFDAVRLAPPAARVVVCYYGITPPELAAPEQRPALHAARRQLADNLPAADRVIVTSRRLRDDLTGLGVAAERVVQLPLPASFHRPIAEIPARPNHSGLTVLCVGRFVPAKGVHDLLEAIGLAQADLPRPLTVALVGSRTFSDRRYLAELEATAQELSDTVRFLFDIDESALIEQMLAADVLAAPSYHEGFCVPVIEALSCGAGVICSDAGALPETSGGLGRSYPVGDPQALADRLREFAAARAIGVVATDVGRLPVDEWRERVAEYLRPFAFEQYQAAFCATVLDGREDAGPSVALREALPPSKERGPGVTVPLLDHDLEARLAATIALFQRR